MQWPVLGESHRQQQTEKHSRTQPAQTKNCQTDRQSNNQKKIRDKQTKQISKPTKREENKQQRNKELSKPARPFKFCFQCSSLHFYGMITTL